MTSRRTQAGQGLIEDEFEDEFEPDLRQFVPLAKPHKLAEDASSILREQILSGGLRRGMHLVEAKLASRLRVSRGTVREAFKTLAAEGLVEEEPRRGAFVVTLSRSDVREIYDVRAAIEGRAVYLLAKTPSPVIHEQLASMIDDIRAAEVAGDTKALRRSDLAFHERLCALSGNRRLHEIFVRYVPAIQTLLNFDELTYATPDAVADQHKLILDAIKAGQPDLAAREAEQHIEGAREKVAAYFEELQST